MTKVTNGAGTAISTNTYNALGQGVRDVTTSATTDEAYGAGGSLLWRYTGSSTNPSQRAFVPFNGRILAEYYGGSPGGTIFDHPDELGSSTVSTSYNGSDCQEKLYYPFGQFWTGAGSCGMQQVFAQLPDYDSETNQYNTLARHYTPMGRWMTPDPGGGDVTNPQSLNRYAYSLNNPTSLSDPLGLFTVVPPGCVAVSDNNPDGTSHVECPDQGGSSDCFWEPGTDILICEGAPLQTYFHGFGGRLPGGGSGSVEQDQLYYPWGQEWTGISWFEPKYSAMGWRDNETGLDWTAARFYTSNAGRWMTPDPGGLKVVHPDDPQTWNMFAYVGNSPTTLTDPTGLYMWASACADSNTECQQSRQAFRDSLANVAQARDSYDAKSKEYKRLDAIIQGYGQEGKGGPAVAFGAAAGSFGGNFNPRTNTVTLDLQKLSTASGAAVGSNQFGSLLATETAHEGEHYVDTSLGLHSSQSEYRAYQASAWTAQGEGMPNLANGQGGRGVIWSSGWDPAMRDISFTTGFLETWKDFYVGVRGIDPTIYLPFDPVTGTQ